MRKPTLPEVGLYIALAALLVNSPRYVQIFLKVDGLTMGAWEPWVLGITGAATGLVLSGGQMYIAHLVAQPTTKRGGWYWTVILVWASMLVFSVILIAPVLVAGIAHAPDLAAVLDMRGRWVWAIVAVTSVEILAAGSMVAMGIAGHGQQEKPVQAVAVHVSIPPDGQPKHLPAQRPRRAARPKMLTVQSSKKMPRPPSRPVDKSLPSWLDGVISERSAKLSGLVRFYASNPASSQRAAAEALGMGKSTVGNHLADLADLGVIDRATPGQIKVLVDPDTWTPPA